MVLSVCNGVISLNPCLDYVFLYNADGLRSSDFDSGNSETSICDAFLDPGGCSLLDLGYMSHKKLYSRLLSRLNII